MVVCKPLSVTVPVCRKTTTTQINELVGTRSFWEERNGLGQEDHRPNVMEQEALELGMWRDNQQTDDVSSSVGSFKKNESNQERQI